MIICENERLKGRLEEQENRAKWEVKHSYSSILGGNYMDRESKKEKGKVGGKLGRIGG